jgi:hypothetical protein
MNRALLMAGLLAVVLAVAHALPDGPSVNTLAGKKSFPKMAKSTYIKVLENTPGFDLGGGHRAVSLPCDSGDKVLSGGFDKLDVGTTVTRNLPPGAGPGFASPLDRWDVEWLNDGTNDSLDVYVLCADFPPKHET